MESKKKTVPVFCFFSLNISTRFTISNLVLSIGAFILILMPPRRESTIEDPPLSLPEQLQALIQISANSANRLNALIQISTNNANRLDALIQVSTNHNDNHLDALIQISTNNANRLDALITHMGTHTESITKIVNILSNNEQISQPPPPSSPPQNNNLLPPKIHLPIFDGSNPLDWIFQAENYFTYYSIPPPQRLSLAVLYFTGDALSWYKRMANTNILGNWPEFTRALHLRFGPSTYDNHQPTLFKLRQTASVSDYQTECEKISNQVISLSPLALRNRFISRLSSDIQSEPSLHNPQTLEPPSRNPPLLTTPSSSSPPILPIKRLRHVETQRQRHKNLYKWPESDAEFMKTTIGGSNQHHREKPRVVDSISCRQLYLRSYTFSKQETAGRAKKCLDRVREKVVVHRRRKRKGVEVGHGRRRCVVVMRRVKTVSRTAVCTVLKRLSCCTSVNVD